jgi:hypothetical protein
MRFDDHELAAEYCKYSDEEVAALAAEMDKLTDGARVALQIEIERRGMSSVQLEKLHAKELHRESRFDQMETIRRKKIALSRLPSDWKGWIWTGVGILGLVLFEWLRSRLR